MNKNKLEWPDWLNLCKKLSSEQKQFLEVINSLNPEDREKKEMFGKWSAKDLLSHIAAWENEVVKMFNLFLVNPYVDDEYNIDSFNEESVISRKKIPWDEIVNELISAQQKLITFVSSLSQKDIDTETRFSEWISVLINHYKHHTEQVKTVKNCD